MSQPPLSSTIPKLYLLTNDDEFELLYQKLNAALSTGLIALLQIRRKRVLSLPDGVSTLFDEAQKIVELAKVYSVPVVINDDVKMAEKLGVGVHLGQKDGNVSDAKQSLAPNQIIGRTCHGDIELVKEAKNDGASYAAMGAVFTSTTKPNADIISRQQLIEGCQQGIPICVIGGLSAENISELAGLPIALVAVVGGIMDLPVADIVKRCHEWQQAFSKWKIPT
ncbi:MULTISPECIES: thiamine phosphate synthase [unclassified Psychrobacter]|uniref:thiamine phosphate synthase n=1 Tax=unclassified Psychrobacter TaxID=196806 RepID=UPI0025B38997|nr:MULTISPECIES: thiamine phosphate synthase [unclassified Psychrobacter]MDN3453994.1 thiamine phosphate synthase [Psychrobacter sp. APC 3350]MDN3503393.1 thiamine phosphate synthase [Psychrobacter sp. 5A.1]